MLKFIITARPMIFSQQLLSIGLSDTFVLSLIGQAPLAYGGLVNSYVLLLSLTAIGFVISILSVNGRSFDAGDLTEVKQNHSAAMALFTLFWCPGFHPDMPTEQII